MAGPFLAQPNLVQILLAEGRIASLKHENSAVHFTNL